MSVPGNPFNAPRSDLAQLTDEENLRFVGPDGKPSFESAEDTYTTSESEREALYAFAVGAYNEALGLPRPPELPIEAPSISDSYGMLLYKIARFYGANDGGASAQDAWDLYLSQKNVGPAGPVGDQGPDGPQGPVGERGIPGNDGPRRTSSIHSVATLAVGASPAFEVDPGSVFPDTGFDASIPPGPTGGPGYAFTPITVDSPTLVLEAFLPAGRPAGSSVGRDTIVSPTTANGCRVLRDLVTVTVAQTSDIALIQKVDLRLTAYPTPYDGWFSASFTPSPGSGSTYEPANVSIIPTNGGPMRWLTTSAGAYFYSQASFVPPTPAVGQTTFWFAVTTILRPR